ncbi:MAG: T9SS type A sorting domain-containing protein [Ignavibacteriaceae bacterium]|nr:T9SS type A sorting domain-containing protein [Ignavibacteriaceae bacterium]
MVYLNLYNANFRFRSTDSEWLLIENSEATILGKGKVNGSGNYGFLITAQSEIEGMECPQGGLRIVIWDIDDGERIVYDNLLPQSTHGKIFIKNFLGDELEKLAAEEGESINLPNEYALEQNYPNPFNPSTTIKYSVPNAENVQLKVYDVIGNEVATLVNETKSPGSYEVPFNASQLSSGVYIYSIRAGNFVETKKMILMK